MLLPIILVVLFGHFLPSFQWRKHKVKIGRHNAEKPIGIPYEDWTPVRLSVSEEPMFSAKYKGLMYPQYFVC